MTALADGRDLLVTVYVPITGFVLLLVGSVLAVFKMRPSEKATLTQTMLDQAQEDRAWYRNVATETQTAVQVLHAEVDALKKSDNLKSGYIAILIQHIVSGHPPPPPRPPDGMESVWAGPGELPPRMVESTRGDS